MIRLQSHMYKLWSNYKCVHVSYDSSLQPIKVVRTHIRVHLYVLFSLFLSLKKTSLNPSDRPCDSYLWFGLIAYLTFNY